MARAVDVEAPVTPAGPDYIALDGLVRLRGCTLGLVVTESTDEVQKDMHRRFYKELTVRPGGSRKLLHRELIHMGDWNGAASRLLNRLR